MSFAMMASRVSYAGVRAVPRAIPKKAPAPRTFVSQSKPRLGGHDDHHHVHNTFEPPFDPKVVGGLIGFCVCGGIGVITFACWFQNKKNGFIKG